MNIKKIFLLLNLTIVGSSFARIEPEDTKPAGGDPKDYLYGVAAYLIANASIKTITEAVNLASSLKTFIKPNKYFIVPAEGNVPSANTVSSLPYVKMNTDQLRLLVPEVAKRPIRVIHQNDLQNNNIVLVIPNPISNPSLWSNKAKIASITSLGAVLAGLSYKYRKKIYAAYVKTTTKLGQTFRKPKPKGWFS